MLKPATTAIKNSLGSPVQPVDAVVTWVDGTDPGHIQKLKTYRRNSPWSITAIPAGRHPTRFKDNGEIYYCLQSIKQFMPWIRNVFIVTDQQRPRNLGLCNSSHPHIRIVDHTEIFRSYEWALPTFNSRSIETVVYRINDLSDRFIYFNDDFILLRPTTVDDFFPGDKQIARGEWLPLPHFGPIRTILSSLLNHILIVFGRTRSMPTLPQMRAARMAGFSTHFFRHFHTPYTVDKTILADHFTRHPEQIKANIKYKFRDMKQFNTIPLAIHLALAANRATDTSERDGITIYFNRDTPTQVERKIDSIAHGTHAFLCLQGFEHASRTQKQRVTMLLDTVLTGNAPKPGH